MGAQANSVPAPAGSKRLMPERGMCWGCGKYYTTEYGVLPRHGLTKPKPKADCAGQLGLSDV
jgi:hypothetical protein